MKLKFEPQVQLLISDIAALPDTAESDEALRQPGSIISELNRNLMDNKGNKKFPTKIWAKLRRQLSFLYDLIFMADKAGRKFGELHSPAMKQESYRFLVKVCKKIVDGTALERPEFVRIALTYGVLYLSDHEIQKLIDDNKV